MRHCLGIVGTKIDLVGLELATSIEVEVKIFVDFCRLRPYHDEYTRSRPITEVKHRRARIVLGWGTAWELPVP